MASVKMKRIVVWSPDEAYSYHSNAVAQGVCPELLTAEPRVLSYANTYGICGGRSGTGASASPSSIVFPSHYHSTIASFSSSS